ncbi:hypothetical protein C8Q74DRAFT_884677 [Fomes fomentarius]|nr:hypothetical protein C8Q74DRAFT_884677 [Fomes fomentarius]
MPTIAPLHTTLTCGLVALCITLLLFGVILSQVFTYARTYKSDGRVFKALVTAIMIGEAAHTALASYASYFYMILNFGNPEVTSGSNLSSTFSFQPLILTIDILLCQYIFIHRLYYVLPHCLRRYYIFLAFSLVLSATGLAIVLTVELVVHSSYSEWLNYKWLVSACFAITAAADIIILVGLVTSLHKSRTGIKRTDTLLDILIVYACSTGLVTCFLSTTCLLVNLLEEKADGPLDTEWLGLSNLKFTVPRTEDHVEEKYIIQPNVTEGLL